jgi:hypothetical protein
MHAPAGSPEDVPARRDGLAVVRTRQRGQPRYVVSDVAAGRHLSISPAAYRLLAALDGRRTLAAAVAAADLSPAEAGLAVRRLAAAGLVVAPGFVPPPPPAPPIEGRAMFLRRELVEVTPFMPMVNGLMGWIFTRWALLLWAMLGVVALVLLSADERRGSLTDWLGQIDALQLLLLYAIFLLLKLVHELAHALALWRSAAEEGLAVNAIRAGIAVMLILPFPFTNVSTAWRLQSKWRRARIGLAGMYAESWVAILAVLAWALLDDPVVRSLAIQVAIVAAVTTLAFNLNPFGRMDGYYVLSDLLEAPNLMQRASAAALRVPARLFRATAPGQLPPPEPGLLLYWAGTAAYRVLVFAGLIWVAHGLSPWLALLMAGIALSLLVVRPALATARALLAMTDDRAALGRRLWLAAGAGVAVAALVPLPAGIGASGIVEASDALFIHLPGDARVGMVRPAARQVTGQALKLESPDLEDAEQEALLASAEALARLRDSVDLGLSGGQAAAEVLAARQARLESLRAEAARLEVAGVAGWDPLDTESYIGAWVRPNSSRPLAVSIPGNRRRIHAVVAEADAARLEAGATARVRVAGRPELAFPARVVRISADHDTELPSAALGRPAGGPIPVDPADPTGRRAEQPFQSVWLAPEPGAPVLRHGQRVELRIGSPPRPLLWQVAAAAGRLLDPRAH